MAGPAHHLSIKLRLGAPKAGRRDLASLTGHLCAGVGVGGGGEELAFGPGPEPSFLPAVPAFPDPRTQYRFPLLQTCPAGAQTRGARPLGQDSQRLGRRSLSAGPAPVPPGETTGSAVPFIILLPRTDPAMKTPHQQRVFLPTLTLHTIL